jgi:selenide,water dikinase
VTADLLDPAAASFPALPHARGRAGCNCKLGPQELAEILDGPWSKENGNILAGLFERDDASVTELGDGRVIAASVDFQNPVTSNYRVAGAIAAANAMSDIYAMGLAPSFANVILSVSESEDAVPAGRDLMFGLHAAAKDAGCIIAGGHTFHGLEPLCGLAVYGFGEASRIKRKSGAMLGDVVILTKALGSGMLTAAASAGFKVGDDHTRGMLRLNRAGVWLGARAGVHAMTDVSGFGLLGHACEMAEASDKTLELDVSAIPMLRGAIRFAMESVGTALGAQTLAAWEHAVQFARDVSRAERAILADPQTNGGLLIAAAAEEADDLITRLRQGGDDEAAVIGSVRERSAVGELLAIRSTG